MSDTPEIVDVVFPLRGGTIANDYADLLWQAVREALPWADEEPALAIHPLGRIGEGEGCRFLSRHSRLVLRLPTSRVGDAGALAGRSLDLGGTVKVDGEGKVRELALAKVVYSSFVTVGMAGEVEFVAECRRLLAEAGIAGEAIVGKAQEMRVGDEEVRGFSLLLHGLRGEHSLRLQGAGLGTQRKRGCGVFVQHRSVAPVGGEM